MSIRMRENRVFATDRPSRRKRAILAHLKESILTGKQPFARQNERRRLRPSCKDGNDGKRNTGFADILTSPFCGRRCAKNNKNGRRPPFSAAFQTAVPPLCGKKIPSLLKEENFFQQRNSILCGQKREGVPGNALYEHFPGLLFNIRHAQTRPPQFGQESKRRKYRAFCY